MAAAVCCVWQNHCKNRRHLLFSEILPGCVGLWMLPQTFPATATEQNILFCTLLFVVVSNAPHRQLTQSTTNARSLYFRRNFFYALKLTVYFLPSFAVLFLPETNKASSPFVTISNFLYYEKQWRCCWPHYSSPHEDEDERKWENSRTLNIYLTHRTHRTKQKIQYSFSRHHCCCCLLLPRSIVLVQRLISH